MIDASYSAARGATIIDIDPETGRSQSEEREHVAQAASAEAVRKAQCAEHAGERLTASKLYDEAADIRAGILKSECHHLVAELRDRAGAMTRPVAPARGWQANRNRRFR